MGWGGRRQAMIAMTMLRTAVSRHSARHPNWNIQKPIVGATAMAAIVDNPQYAKPSALRLSGRLFVMYAADPVISPDQNTPCTSTSASMTL